MAEREVVEVYRKKGVRLTAEMSPLLYKYFYAHEWPDIVHLGWQMFDKAHAVMLVETGVIPREVGIGILRALRQLDTEGAVEGRRRLGGHLHCGEAYVTKVAGPDVGGWIHCGRSTGDLAAVAHRIAVRDYEIRAMEAINQARGVFIQRADEHAGTVMPGYTHLQHAEPITYGFYLLSWVHQLERDFGRLMDALGRANTSPAGCAILTTTDFPLDRHATQRLLGFDQLYTNAKDAIWSVDYCMEALGAVLCSGSGLGRLAEDLNTWHSSEFGLVEHPDEYCGTSSIMPQKKNPYGTECVRGLVGDIIGKVTAFAATTKAASDACEMVLMAQAHVYDAFDRYLGALEIMTGIVDGLKINAQLMRQRAGMYWSQASTLANVIVREKQVPFRTAHQLVGILVRLAYEDNKLPEQVTAAMLDRASVELNGEPLGLSEDALRRALDPESVIESRRLVGGPSSEHVGRDIAYANESLQRDTTRLSEVRARLARAERDLEEAIDRIIGQQAESLS